MLQRLITILFVAASMGFAWKSWEAYYLAGDLAAERSALSQMTEKRDEWQRAATESAALLDEAERRRRLAEADIKALQEALAEQGESYDTLRHRIQRSPVTDDGPVAPVLRDTLERLP